MYPSNWNLWMCGLGRRPPKRSSLLSNCTIRLWTWYPTGSTHNQDSKRGYHSSTWRGRRVFASSWRYLFPHWRQRDRLTLANAPAQLLYSKRMRYLRKTYRLQLPISLHPQPLAGAREVFGWLLRPRIEAYGHQYASRCWKHLWLLS